MELASIDDARKLLVEQGFSAVAEEVLSFSKPAIKITNTPAEPASLTQADSFFGGGFAFLPPGVEWPMAGGIPLEPIASILLSQVAAHDPLGLLPRHGRLTFWYDVVSQPWGHMASDRDGFRVTFDEDEATPRERAMPPEESDPYSTSRLGFAPRHTFLDPYSGEGLGMALEEHNLDRRYDDLVSKTRWNPKHQLLGQPFLVQESMEGVCETRSRGFDHKSTRRATQEEQAAMNQGANDWMLLLQVDCDDGSGVDWFNEGLLYYWIRKQDLAARRFDNVWVQLQTT